jgi:type I restriction enzyme, S subunit
MKLKPGYKQTEVGVVPEDWESYPLGEIGKFKNGINKGIEAFGHGSPFVNLLDVFGVNSIASTENLGLVASTKFELNTYDLRKGDVLFIRSSVKPSGVGLTAVIEKDLPGAVFSGFLIRFRDLGQVDTNFKRYCFYEEGFRRKVISASSVSANTNINQDNLKTLSITLPPTKAEQEAIAEALSDVDALIGSLEKLIAKKRHLKQGAMQLLLTGKKRLPGFCGDWDLKSLGDLFDFSAGFSASRDQLSTEGYCYLHYGDIHLSSKTYIDVRSEYHDIPKLYIPLKRVSKTSLLKDGDVVFVDASEDNEGTSKHVVIVNEDNIPFISGLHTIVAKTKNNELDQRYRRYCFQTRDIKCQFYFYSVGTKVSGISKTNIAKITLPVPQRPEQEAIATILGDMDVEIAALETKLAKARQIKQGMMQELLTGRIRLI